MSISTATLIKEDCAILIDRALHGKTICAFGEDGLGKYGRQERGLWFKIIGTTVMIECDDDEDPSEMIGFCSIQLEGYRSSVTGHIMTDHNFDICLKAFLKNANIDPEALKWPDTPDDQGDGYVTLIIDVPLLIGWP